MTNRKERLQRLIAEGRQKYIIKSLVIHTIILSIVLTVAGVFGIGSIKGIEWILVSMILFWVGMSALISNMNWKKLNEEFRNLK